MAAFTPMDLPGVQVRVESLREAKIPQAPRGVALLAVLDHPYGPAGKLIELDSSAPDAQTGVLGFNLLEDSPATNAARAAFQNAAKVSLVLLASSGGAKATATEGNLTVTAKHNGARGDVYSVSSVANPTGGFDVTVFLGTVAVGVYEGVANAEDLPASKHVDFSGTGALTAFASLKLTGGANAPGGAAEVAAVFVPIARKEPWNSVAVCVPDAALATAGPVWLALRALISDLRDESQYRLAVEYDRDGGADMAGVYNLANTVAVNGAAVPVGVACAWLAGLVAGHPVNDTITGIKYPGAKGVAYAPPLQAGETFDEIGETRAGRVFFAVDGDGDAAVRYGINSLTTFAKPHDDTHRKDRVWRTLSQLANDIRLAASKLRIGNDEDGYTRFRGVAKQKLVDYSVDSTDPTTRGALKNIDYDADITIDEALSADENVVMRLGAQPVDAAEKFYIGIETR